MRPSVPAPIKNARGATDQVKFINYLTENRLTNERMTQAIHEMGSVVAVIGPMYTKLDEPTVNDVLAEINHLGGVGKIHTKYIADETKRLAEEQEESDRRAKARKIKLAEAAKMTLEDYEAAEKRAKQQELRDRNKPKRDRSGASAISVARSLSTVPSTHRSSTTHQPTRAAVDSTVQALLPS